MGFIRKLWQCFFCWKVEAGPIAISRSDAVLSLSFGGGNRALAGLVWRVYCAFPRLPLIVPREVAYCMSALPEEGNLFYIIRKHRHIGKRLDTFEFLSQAWQICQAQQWKKVAIIAHPDHCWRVVKTAEKIGFDVITGLVSARIYDKKSVQWWTKSRARFIVWEILARIFYLYKGWI